MNGLTPPKSGAAEWPPGPTPRASRGAPEPSDAFAGILDTHQARTANAEGQDRSPKTEGRNRRDDNGPAAVDRREADVAKGDRPVQHHEDDAQAKPADSVEAPAAPAQAAAAAVPVVEALPEAAGPQPTADSPQVAPTQPVAQQPAVRQEQPVAQVPVQPAQPQTVETPTQVVAKAEEAAAPVVQQTEQADAQPVVQETPAADKPASQVPVAKPKQEQPQTGQQQGDKPHEQGSLPEQASDQARTVAQAYGRSVQQHAKNEVPTTAQSGTPAAPAATPVASGQPAAARGELAPATPVPLARAAETVEQVLRLASSRGVTHARIALKPESLGSIDVHMRHTSDGIVAKLVAHSPDAVQHLQQAAADLRQQLEGQGVNVLSLDIGHSPDERSAASAGAGFGDERGERGGEANASGDAAADDAETTVNSTLQLPDGVLVDVLA